MKAAPERRLAAALAALLLAPVALAAQQPSDEPDTVVARLPAVRVEVARLAVGGVPLARAPFGAQVVTGPELRQITAPTLADVLQRLPGVSTADVLGTPYQPDLSMRGFGISPVMGLPQGLSVFVDGVRINEPDASQVNFSLIPLHDLERIEVLRGPSGPFGKNALGGSIHLVTRRGGSERTGGIDLVGGSFGRAEGRAYAGGGSGPLDYYVSGRYSRSDGWRDDSAVRLRQLFAKTGFSAGRTDLWLSFSAASDSLLQAGSLPASWLAEPATVPERFRRGAGDPRVINFTGGDYYAPVLHFLTASLAHRLGPDLQLQGNAFLRRNRSTQFNANFIEPDIRIRSEVRSLGGTTQLAYAAGPLQLTGGVEYALNDIDLNIFRHPNENHPELPVDGLQTEDVGTREHNAAFFAQLRAEPRRGLGLTGSLRYDYVDLPFRDRLEPENSGDNLFRQLTGTLGADYLLSQALVAFASYGRGFRAPVIMELACADPEDPCPLPYELGADPPLRPVTTDTWQAGLRVFSSGGAAVELVGYWAEVHHDIFFVQPPETRAGFFQNLDRTRRQGLELAAAATPLRWLEIHGSVALTRATFRTTATLWAPYLDDDDDDDLDLDDLEPPTVGPGDHFPMVPGLSATFGMDGSLGRWRIGVRAIHIGRQWLRGDEDNETPDGRLSAYTLLGARAEREVGRALFFIAAENLLDTEYASFGVLGLNRLSDPAAPHVEPFVTPGPPRRLLAGLHLRVW